MGTRTNHEASNCDCTSNSTEFTKYEFPKRIFSLLIKFTSILDIKSQDLGLQENLEQKRRICIT